MTMSRSHEPIPVELWDDPRFLELSADCKVLYLALRSHATTSRAGVADWRPGRWARLVGTTTETAQEGGRQLAHAGFLTLDEQTEEALVRRYVTPENGLNSPNLATSMVNAAAAIFSPTVRAALRDDLRALYAEQPELKGWPVIRERLPLDLPELPAGASYGDLVAAAWRPYRLDEVGLRSAGCYAGNAQIPSVAQAPDAGASVVYVLLNAELEPVYLGSTGTLVDRLLGHRRDGKKWAAWVALPVIDRETAYAVEDTLLRQHMPVLNARAGR